MLFGSVSPVFRQFVFDGDSHVYGNDDPDNAWTVFLMEYTNLSPCRSANIAHNGWVWQDMVNNFSEAIPYMRSSLGKDATLWFDIGTNNIQRGDGDTLIDGVDEFIDLVRSYGSYCCATVPWMSPSWNATQQSQLSAYRSFILGDSRLSATFDSATVFDDPNNPPYFDPDGHLNPTGQQLYAQSVHQILASSKHFL